MDHADVVDDPPKAPGAGPRLTERILAAATREPMSAPHRLRNDCLLALAACVLSVLLGTLGDSGRRPDALGWALLLASALLIAVRRQRPVLAVAGLVACVAPYHAMDNSHAASMFQTCVILYTVAATGRPLRTLFVALGVLTLVVSVVSANNAHEGLQLLRISGWILAMLFLGIDVRVYRQYVASLVQRAERAERTREEEARRRVAEERLRIARDLHDLLAHSITLIGVQTSVAAHVLEADPERLDRKAVAGALEDIAETCRTARGELRTTLEVLRRSDPGGGRGPVPGLDGVADLARAARTAGATVEVSVRAAGVPPSVGATAYRIVQEALTNAVRHAGPSPSVRVELHSADGTLHVAVSDDGRGGQLARKGRGFGLTGMRERARSVGGAFTAGPRSEGGFAVRAALPLPAADAAP
ncbi:sensor histidine kinase [Streptomyces sp. SCSIO ZS0520]|uniref:sensor histidine kinase n=1 Tax=Streptomyces sp. SCSIO ZS0520 TaxID=2892996 RepID=UPI0021D7E119|nr:histidine kinase [Streptomyces sp. SCSIO ZS0520]